MEQSVNETAADPQMRSEARYRLLLADVPAHLHDGIVGYLVHRHRPGSFLWAVLSNDLLMAVKRGDDESQAGLCALVCFLYNHAPIPSWGSSGAVTAWLSGKANV